METPAGLARLLRTAGSSDLIHIHGDSAALVCLPALGRHTAVITLAGCHLLRRAGRVRGAVVRLGLRQDEAGFVYSREDGEPMQPRSLTHACQEAIGATGLPRIRFHDLRYAHAAHLLASGIHPKVASERLGRPVPRPQAHRLAQGAGLRAVPHPPSGAWPARRSALASR